MNSASQTTAPQREYLSETIETIANYDQTATRFAAHWGDLRLERALEAFVRRVAGQRRVLDIGCGPGRDVGFLGQLGCQAMGLDRSVGMLAQARQRLLRGRPRANLVLADLRHLPMAPHSFDGIWACASLLHLPRTDLPLALAEVKRLLHHPDGIFYLAVKAGHGERWAGDDEGRRFFFTYYEPAEIQTLLQQAGFQVLESWVDADQSGRREPWLNVVAITNVG